MPSLWDKLAVGSPSPIHTVQTNNFIAQIVCSLTRAWFHLTRVTQVPAAATAVLWLYSEVLPQQLLTHEQVAAIVRALSLSQNQAVVVNQIEQSLADARFLCETAGSL